MRLQRRDGALTLEPWPFTASEVTVHAAGRLLETTFTDQEQMRAALAEAPEITLEYELLTPGARSRGRRRAGRAAGRVEDRHRSVVLAHEQVDLGAAQEDALGAAVGELGHDPPVLLPRVVVARRPGTARRRSRRARSRGPPRRARAPPGRARRAAGRRRSPAPSCSAVASSPTRSQARGPDRVRRRVARCARTGCSMASTIASATLCIVFVHSTSSSAPACSSGRASPASSAPGARPSRPSRWSRSTSAKSTERIRQSAECSSPRRSRTSSLTSR